jgi:hypothetical protein
MKEINDILSEINEKILKLNKIKTISYIHDSKNKKIPPRLIIDHNIIIDGYDKIYNYLIKIKI